MEETIYVAYYDNEVLCAWTDEERAKNNCNESGAIYQKITLYK